MKGLVVFLIFALLGVFGQQGHWRQVWADEFNGPNIDLSKWQFEVNCDGGGNNELQCYTNRTQNANIQNGKLVITAKPETYNGRDYTSARLNTAASAEGSWLYGRFEMSAKLPNGKFLWPAFWMLPTDNVYGTWAASGEIDIMENRGQENSIVQGTLHFGGMWPNNKYQGSGPIDFHEDLTKDFHIHAVEWDRDTMRWFLDQNNYFNMSLDRNFYSGSGTDPYTANRQPFDQRFHYVINMAVGGGFFPANPYGTLTTQDAMAWPDPTYQIDYIRVYTWDNTTNTAGQSSNQGSNAASTPVSNTNGNNAQDGDVAGANNVVVGFAFILVAVFALLF